MGVCPPRRGRGQGIKTVPCSPRVGRVFSIRLREKMETTVDPPLSATSTEMATSLQRPLISY